MELNKKKNMFKKYSGNENGGAKAIIFVICCLLSLNGFGQRLTLFKGNDQKTFKESSIFEVVTSESNPDNDNNSCNATELIGKLISISNDSMTLQLSSYTKKRNEENFEGANIFNLQAWPMKATIAQKEIVYLKNFKSYKSRNRKDGFQIAGGILLFTGAVTALNTFVVKDKSNKGNLLLSGGAQVGLGIGFLIAGSSKKYNLRNNEEIWTIKK